MDRRRLSARLIRHAATMLVAGVMAAGPSFAASLLTPAAGFAESRNAGDTLTLRQRLVSLDIGILATQIHPANLDLSPDRAANSRRLAGRVSVDLFDGLSVNLQRGDVEAGVDGGVIWTADAPGQGYAIFALAGNKLMGVIETAGRRFLIEPAGSGRHRLREIDVPAYPKDRHIERPDKASQKAAENPAPSRAVTMTYFNLLVAYTAKAKATMIAGGATLGQAIDLDIAIVNQGLKNSGVPARIKRAGTVAVSSTYNEDAPSDPVQPIYDITSGSTANFPAIRALRNTLAADLVALYIDRTPTPYCGVAWVNYPVPSATYGFGAVDADCRGSVTLAHELGHTMGLFHDRYVEPAAPSSQHDFGYVSIPGNFRTIMSYSDKCWDTVGHDCQVITYFSTPNKIFNGQPTGIPKGPAGAADAARWIREKRTIISTFR